MEFQGYIIKPSTRKNKKYDAFNKEGKKIASFGDKRYQHYFDKIGYYSDLNHLDKERKRLYYARHGKEAKKGTPKYFSHNILW
jgi:hypothetical protein